MIKGRGMIKKNVGYSFKVKWCLTLVLLLSFIGLVSFHRALRFSNLALASGV